MRCDCGSTRFRCDRCNRVYETREQDLTSRQREILWFMRQQHRDTLAPVVVSDIADHFVLHVSTIRHHLRTLRKVGLIYHPYDEFSGKTRLNSGWIPVPSEEKTTPLFRKRLTA